MEYLLKASGVIIVFYVFYKLLLQRDTFFKQNRWFLLFGLLLALVVPLFVFPVEVEYYAQNNVNLSNLTKGDIISTATISSLAPVDYVMIIYVLGVKLFLIRFLFQMASLARVFTRNKREWRGSYTYVETQAKTSPFSFFKWIAYNPEHYTSVELEQIIAHEKVHASQYHSIDVLMSQLISIAFWFNPFIWFYNREVKQNLEFLADHDMVSKEDCMKAYQYTLLKTSVLGPQLAIGNNFYNSSVKKRIAMLGKSRSKNINRLKYLLIIPSITLFLMCFNAQEVAVIRDLPENNQKVEYGDVSEFYIEKENRDVDLHCLKAHLASTGYTFETTNIKRDEDNFIISIDLSVSNHYTNAHFSSNSHEPISTIKIVTNKKTNSISIGNNADNVFNFVKAWDAALLHAGDSPLIVIDGKIIGKTGNGGTGFSVHKFDIQSLNALVGKEALDKYGDQGKDGVIEITNKSARGTNL